MASDPKEASATCVISYVRRDQAIEAAVRLGLTGKAAQTFVGVLSSIELMVSARDDGTPVIRSIDREEIQYTHRENDFNREGLL